MNHKTIKWILGPKHPSLLYIFDMYINEISRHYDCLFANVTIECDLFGSYTTTQLYTANGFGFCLIKHTVLMTSLEHYHINIMCGNLPMAFSQTGHFGCWNKCLNK